MWKQSFPSVLKLIFLRTTFKATPWRPTLKLRHALFSEAKCFKHLRVVFIKSSTISCLLATQVLTYSLIICSNITLNKEVSKPVLYYVWFVILIKLVLVLNPFLANIFRDYKMETLARNGLRRNSFFLHSQLEICWLFFFLDWSFHFHNSFCGQLFQMLAFEIISNGRLIGWESNEKVIEE